MCQSRMRRSGCSGRNNQTYGNLKSKDNKRCQCSNSWRNVERWWSGTQRSGHDHAGNRNWRRYRTRWKDYFRRVWCGRRDWTHLCEQRRNFCMWMWKMRTSGAVCFSNRNRKKSQAGSGNQRLAIDVKRGGLSFLQRSF